MAARPGMCSGSSMHKILPLLMLGSATLACSMLASPASPATTEATLVPPTATSVPGLTADQVKNAAYQLVFQDSHATVQLTDGSYQHGSSPTASDFADVRLAGQMAFGDLNGDGAGDAAVLLAEN